MIEKTKILFFDRLKKYRKIIRIDEEVLKELEINLYFCNSYVYDCPWENYSLFILHIDDIKQIFNISKIASETAQVLILYDTPEQLTKIAPEINCFKKYSTVLRKTFEEKFREFLIDLKERYQLDLNFREKINYNLFFKIHETSNIVFILDENFNLVYANFYFLNSLKYFWKEIANHSFNSLLSQEEFDKFLNEIQIKLKKKLPWCGDINLYTKDHRIINVRGAIFPISEKNWSYYCTFVNNTKLKEVESELKSLVKEQQVILDNTMIGIIYVIDRKIIWANPKFLEILGYSWDELRFRNSSIIYPSNQDYLEVGEKAYSALDNLNQYFAEIKLKRKDGRILDTKYSGKYIDPKKPEKGSIWMIEDITKEKKFEQELLYSRNLFEKSISALSDMFAIIDKKSWLIISCNKIVKDIFGYTQDEVTGNYFKIFLSQTEDENSFFTDVTKSIELNNLFVSEKLMARKNGDLFSAEIKITEIRDDLGNQIYVCIIRDITESKERENELKRHRNQMEELVAKRTEKLAGVIEKLEDEIRVRRKVEGFLRKTQKSFAEAQKIAKIGNWEWNLKDNSLYWSDEIYNIFGLNKKDFMGSYDDFVNAIHPDDRDIVLDEITEALEKGKIYNIEHRIITPDNKIKIVHEKGDVYFEDETGKPILMIGTVQDISNRKKMESQLELATTVLENAIEGVVITDRATKILSINPAFTKITGYTAKDVLGKKINILKSHIHNVDFYSNMWKKLNSEGFWQGEIWNRKKNGEAYPEWLTISAIKDHKGKLTTYVAVFYDMSEIKMGEERLQYHLNFDGLTNVYNKNFFKDRLKQKIEEVKNKKNQKFCLILLGLDRFKKINESLGHVEGDKLLKSVAEKLNLIKEENDVFARWESDEFVFLINDINDTNDIISFTFDILSSFKQPFQLKNHSIFLTSSFGIAVYPNDGDNAATLLKNVDIAMHRAKEFGKNNYQFYSPELSKETQQRLTLEGDLRTAIQLKEFELFYQPKVDGKTGKIVGVEALIRWIHREKGIISPGEFIPILEENDLIIPLSEWIIEQACLDNKTWQEKYNHFIPVSVNISAIHFMNDTLLGRVSYILKKSKLEGKYLDLEITEGLLIDDVEYSIAIMKKLKQLDVLLSIDDFGTGYSSLSYLKKFPVDQLKIDRSFVSDIGKNEEDTSLVKAIILLGHSLNLKLIAEGVENSMQLEFLLEHQCDEIQGYYFSKPLCKEDFEKLLVDSSIIENKIPKV